MPGRINDKLKIIAVIKIGIAKLQDKNAVHGDVIEVFRVTSSHKEMKWVDNKT